MQFTEKKSGVRCGQPWEWDYTLIEMFIGFTIGLVMMAPSNVKREEKPRGVQTDINRTPSIETTE